MKIIEKKAEPHNLEEYRKKHPAQIWENVPGQVRKDCRQQCMTDQGNICCYCECNLLHPVIKGFCRVEHFHQKSNTTPTGKNWHLDWQNMLAACNGQTDKHKRTIYPHPNNLSCDAYKNYLVQKGLLPVQCTGFIINPLQIPAFPNLFEVDFGTGKLFPNDNACAQVTIPDNAYATTKELVQKTIDNLNLNCDRLCDERKAVLRSINNRIAQARMAGNRSATALPVIVHQYFSQKWPQYFTTIRCRLGKDAEDYLRSISFQG